MEIYNKVRQVPQNAQKPINGGRLKGMTDINPQWRIQTLTEQFGMCGFGWYYTIEKEWIEESGNESCAFVDINLYVNHKGEWSKPIHGTGGSKFLSNEKSGPYLSDECFKMATTDALSVACKQLGMGADIYWQAGRTKYSKGDDMQALPTYTEEKPKKSAAEPTVDEVAKKLGTTREEMIAVAKAHYPEGSKQLAALLATWNIDSIDNASTAQLMAVWSKYNKK